MASVKKAIMEAALVFKPVIEARASTGAGVRGNAHITLRIRDNDVELIIGQERRVRASRHGWQRDLLSRTLHLLPDLGTLLNERTVPDFNDVVTFIVRACAEFLARKP
jgi:hypothetical protein